MPEQKHGAVQLTLSSACRDDSNFRRALHSAGAGKHQQRLCRPTLEGKSEQQLQAHHMSAHHVNVFPCSGLGFRNGYHSQHTCDCDPPILFEMLKL